MATPYNAASRRRPGLGRTQLTGVTELQRARVLAAATDAIAELGYARLTVTQVITRARVSRKTFYELFRDRDECFLTVFGVGISRARAVLAEAYDGEGSWRAGVRAALARLLALLDEEPALGRVCIVEALGAGEAVLLRRAAVVGELAAVVDRGRAQPGAAQPPEVISQAVVGAVFSVLHARSLEHDPEPFANLLPALMSMIVLPYLGARASRAELARRSALPSPNGPRRAGRRPADPLVGLEMRLTYRTARVLGAIAALPGASNREIALRSGVSDQGQMSKLLARLARLGLVENRGAGQERGAANAWRLTDRGARVERATWSR